MAQLLQPLPPNVKRLGVLPAAFNPVTVAHLALADAAAAAGGLDAVVFALPVSLPHKTFHGATFEDRRAMLEASLAGRPERLPAIAERGLMYEIVDEIGAVAGPDVALCLICGRDAAERIAGWDYGEGPSFAEQLERFELLAASREGGFRAPAGVANRVHCFAMPADCADVSSTAVRTAIANREDVDEWVPEAALRLIRQRGLYRDG